MKSGIGIVVVVGCLLLGCEKPRPASQAVAQAVTGAAAGAGMPVELFMQDDPPVRAKCKLMDLQSAQAHRRLIVYDLNGDGSSEYFIENYAGANSVGFALVDSVGRLLVKRSDVGDLGGDRIVILAATHEGYHDIVCSHSDPGGIDGSRWEFNGKRYVQVRQFRLSSEERREAFVERIPGAAVARWYCDVFGRPPGDWPTR